MTNYTPVKVTEMRTVPAGGPRDRSDNRIVARFADWDDARAVARRWSEGKSEVFYEIEFNDGFTIATETWLNGAGGDYVERLTAKGRAYRARFHTDA